MLILTNGHVIIGNLTWEHIGILLLLCLCGVLAKILPYMKRKGPVKECRATIKSKRIEYSNTPQFYYRGDRWNHLILFINDDGNEIELFTGEHNFVQLKENSTGILKYQNDKIIEFIED